MVAQLSAKALEDPNFQQEIDDLLAKTDEQILKGLNRKSACKLPQFIAASSVFFDLYRQGPHF